MKKKRRNQGLSKKSELFGAELFFPQVLLATKDSQRGCLGNPSGHEGSINENVTTLAGSDAMESLFDAIATFAGRRKLFGFMMPSSSDMGDSQCGDNCSGHGECLNGSCYCQIRFEGTECKRINFSYHVAFASIHFLLALIVLIQLVMCIHAGKQNGSQS